MAVEDFTTYTETDPGSDITVTSTKIDCINFDDSQTYNVYKDKGTDHFNALDVDFETYLSSSSTSNAQFGPGFVNTATPATETRANLATTDCWNVIYVSGTVRIYLIRGAFVANDSYQSLSANTTYYCTYTRTASSDTVTLKIYSDSGRTSLIDTLSVSGFGTSTKWQYMYGLLMHTGSDGANNTGYIQNIDLNEVDPPAPTFTPKVMMF